MADVADLADVRRETMERAALSYRADTSNTPKPIGECHHCGEEVDGERIFCDAVCARAWNHDQERMRRNQR